MGSLKPAWELPYVNVFKLCGMDNWVEVAKGGDVVPLLDKRIGKKVLELKGSIPTRNYVQLPKTASKSLGLTGRFCYVQICPGKQKKWTFHLDVQTTDKNVYRISIGNVYSKRSETAHGVQIQQHEGAKRGVSVQLELPADRWVTIALDLATILQPATVHSYETLRAARFCASMRVRNLFTTEHKYGPTSIPKDVAMVPVSRQGDVDFLWLPEEPVDVETLPDSPQRPDVAPGSLFKPKSSKKKTKPPKEGWAHLTDQADSSIDQSSVAEELVPSIPDPCLLLERVNGYTGEFTRSLMWSPSSDEAVFACNATVVAMAADGSKQRFFMGHTSNVCAMAFGKDGRLLATGQEGRTGLIRVWDFKSGNCLAIVCGHQGGGLVCLDISPDSKAMAAVGADSQGRQTIALWDISRLGHPQGREHPHDMGRAPPLVLRQSTEYNVRSLRFSPYEDDRLMTCGKDSIRNYRLKGGQLRGISIRLVTDPTQCGARPLPPGTSSVALAHNLFTDIAYEATYGLQTLEELHVFVSSASGAVFQVNYGRRELECVYQCHNAPINAIRINEGFCVTASDDKFVRVWPVDFSDFFLEAEHETAVSSVGLSPDGLRIAVGCEGGAIGVMDVPTHTYTTLLRSHTGAVNCVAVDDSREQFATASDDGTIRVWGLNSFEQLFEFSAPGEKVNCVAYHPKRNEIAAGFSTGLVRVFDIGSASLMQEHQQHRGSVTSIAVSVEGDRMFSGANDGAVCVYDILQNYLPIKYLSTSRPGFQILVACSPDGRLLATTSYEPGALTASLLIFHSGTLDPYMRIETTAPAFNNIQFNPSSTEIVAVSKDRKLDRFDITTGLPVASIVGVHRVSCQALHCHQSMIATGGSDGLVKVWPYCKPGAPPEVAGQYGQSYIGHSDNVTCVCFAGNKIVTTDSSDAILIWKLQGAEDASPSPSAALADKSNVTSSVSGSAATRRMAWLLPDGGSSSAGASPITKVGDENAPPPEGATDDKFPPAPLTFRGGSVGPDSLNSAAMAAASEGPGGKSIRSMPPRVMADSVVGYSGNNAYQNVVWHPPSAFFAYSVDSTVVVEDLVTRKQRYFAAHTKPISSLAINSNSTILASAAASPELSGTADICLWNIETGTCGSVLSYHPSAVQAMAFTEDSSWLVSIGRKPECSVVLWDVATSKVTALGRAKYPVHAICWRPLTAPVLEFVTVGGSQALRWTLEPTHLSQRTIGLPVGFQDAELTAVICRESCCYIGDSTGSVWRFELDALGEPPLLCFSVAKKLRVDGPGSITAMAAVGDRMVVGTADGQVVEFHLAGGDAAGETWTSSRCLELDGSVNSLVMNPDCTEGVVGTAGCTLWYITTSPQATRVPLVYGHARPVLSLATSPDDTTLVASTSGDGLLRIWRIATNDAYVLMEFESPYPCTRAVFVTGSKVCVAGYQDGTLRAFDLDKVLILWTVARHESPVVALELAADGASILSAAQDASMAVTAMDAGMLLVHSADMMDRRNGMAMSGIHSALHDVNDLAVSPRDGRMAAMMWANRLSIFATPWRQEQCTAIAVWRASDPGKIPSNGHRASCSFSPRDPHIVVFTSPSSQGRISLFDYRDSSILRSIDIPQPIVYLRPSLNGTLLAAGGTSASIFLINYVSGAWSELVGHSSTVAGVAFCSQSRRLFSAGGETILAWRIA